MNSTQLRSIAERQRISGVRLMGLAAGVTSARTAIYVDSEVRIGYFRLNKDNVWNVEPTNRARFCVLAERGGTIGKLAVRVGNLLKIPAGFSPTNMDLKNTSLFVAYFNDLPAASTLEVLDRIPLQPFEAEQIIVPAGTPFEFYSRFNLAEVIVPPGVVTSEHDLGVNERYLMCSGPATIFLNGEARKLFAGDIAHIPSGTMQYIKNDSAQPLRFYCLCTPPLLWKHMDPAVRPEAVLKDSVCKCGGKIIVISFESLQLSRKSDKFKRPGHARGKEQRPRNHGYGTRSATAWTDN